MKTVAISKLKASLSEFLTKVKKGEEVLITERGKPIAKIIPLDRDDSKVSAHLMTLERAGLVKIGKGKIPGSFWKLPRPKDKKGLVLKTLLQERNEGR